MKSFFRAKSDLSFSSGKANKTNDMTFRQSESKSNWKFMEGIQKRIVYENALSTKDLITVIREC